MESVEMIATPMEETTVEAPVSLPNLFARPDPVELNQGPELIGQCIAIYWDGDGVYYPCTVVRYEPDRDRFFVVYMNDATSTEYGENLRRSSWKIWRGTSESCSEFFSAQGITFILPEEGDILPSAPPPPASAVVKKTKLPTYSSMVLEAVIALNDKEGSSLNAIRKYMLTHYEIKNQQKASFNNLTLKAVNNAVASEVLEKVKHSFRLTAKEREKRRIQEKEDETAKKDGSIFSSLSRKYTPFIVDADSLHSLATTHNKHLRKELLDFRDKRDRFLIQRLDMLKPFLARKNYFKRILRDREARRQAAIAARQEYLRQAEWAYQAGQGYAVPPKHPDEDIEELDAPLRKYLEEKDEETEEEDDVAEADAGEEADTMDVADAATESDPVSNVNGHAPHAPTAASNPIPIVNSKDPESSIIDTVVDDVASPYSTLTGVDMVPQPAMLQATLHDHQFVGISWMVHMFKNGMPMILGDQMGLGKTIQTIGFLAHLHESLKKQGPHLVIVPLSVLSNWLAEIERFCPSFRTVRFHGPKVERDRIKEEEMKDLKEFDIVVTTYEILVSEVNFFRRRFVWTTVIVDEGHRLKNDKSQFSEKLRCVPCVSKVILTGTPLQNNLRELWSMLYYLAPEIFTSSEPFDDGFDLLRGRIDSNVLRQARRLLSVFMLRRLKEEVSIKLPSRKEVTLLVSLTQQQIDLYRQLLCGLDASTIDIVMREGSVSTSRMSFEALPALAESASATTGPSQPSNGSEESAAAQLTTTTSTANPTTDSEWRKLMNILLQLRKICNHTYLLPNIAPEPYAVTEDIVAGSGKLLMLDRMLPALRSDGHRVLIFSQFTSMLDILEDYCELRDYPFVRLDGETNRVKRRLDVRRFNAPNSQLFIFLISTRAGGLGLNLASADTVILYDSDWNPQVDLQAMERAHRIGQEKPVRVFRLVCRGSVEERMISRAEKKLFLNAMVAEKDPDETLQEDGGDERGLNEVMTALGIGGTSLSKGELASLIRFGANAVFEGDSAAEHTLSDEELDRLLERKGRDVEVISVSLSGSVSAANEAAAAAHHKSDTADATAVVDAFEAAQLALKERVSTLKEVDLRQLGDVVYAKKKPTGRQSFLNTSLIIDEDVKRERKERIVMVDGRGTGYGGAVPILSENLSSAAADATTSDSLLDGGDATVVYKARGRQWKHRTFCTLCGRGVKEQELFNKCAHCPFIFHTTCGEQYGVYYRGAGLLICPHHRCVDCQRPTASAGGLLFRCLGCLTSYCEDCLPQDEIESIGRCRALEAENYVSKQAYYIKCPRCCQLEGVRATGVLGDRDHREAQEREAEREKEEKRAQDRAAAAEEGNEETSYVTGDDQLSAKDTKTEDGDGEGDGEAAQQVWATQLMRIHWTEIIDPPKPPPKKGKKSKKRKRKSTSGGSSSKRRAVERGENGKKEAEDVEEDDDDDEEDDEDETEKFHMDLDEPEVPEECDLQTALQLFVDHPATNQLLQLIKSPREGDGDEDEDDEPRTKKFDLDISQEISHILNKVEAERYRSAVQFIRDLKYVIDSRLVSVANRAVTAALSEDRSALREQKEKITFFAKALHEYLASELEPHLQLP